MHEQSLSPMCRITCGPTTRRVIYTSVFLLLSLLFTAFNFPSNEKEGVAALYQSLDLQGNEAPPFDVFSAGLAGYQELETQYNLAAKSILTLIDFRRSANEKRLWVIDLKNKKLLYHSLTAHGRNSGDIFARSFSNTPNSNQSSLGFYVTGKTYIGKHGVSLKLHGVETGFNDNAEARAIVMHGADYVSESFIKKYGRLGRSLGCPAVPMELHKKIIAHLAEGTCLFIFYPDPTYVASSKISQRSIH
jgi:hypothetical protein